MTTFLTGAGCPPSGVVPIWPASGRAVTSLTCLQFQKQLRLIEARRLVMAEGASASHAAYSDGYESIQQGVRASVGDGRNRISRRSSAGRGAALQACNRTSRARLALPRGGRGRHRNSRDRRSAWPCPQAARQVNAPEKAPEHFGAMAMFAGLDIPASSARTRQILGWNPTGPGPIADLDAMRYDSSAA